MSTQEIPQPLLEGVAIVGMSGRFPGARSVAEFWRNQLNGVEAISKFTVGELEIQDAAKRASTTTYVRARGILEDIDLFDASFFGILPREAELMDPQHRLFLECCWESFENAGYDPQAIAGAVGVFAGSSMPTYFLRQLGTDPHFLQRFTEGYQIENFLEMMGSFSDFLATRVSYKLNLRGPSFTMQSACSTSLVAVCQASQSLLTYQCDMALAGGVSIPLPQKRGYSYLEGGMGSADGHTRTFDARADGTVFGSGVAVVLLKRAEDAVRDGDQIYAVIRGFGANNDGSNKVGYTAPSVEGQANVIAMAHAAAGIDPESIGYVEAHGTGTPLGDPIEMAALTKAFRAHTTAKNFCAVGTAKTNVGHLDVAAGATGLIHAVNVVRSGKLPPTLHFEKSNPNFDLANSPFFVNTKLTDWKTNGKPRRAGVSAFGLGGTNAHLILEEAAAVPASRSNRPGQLLTVSARSAAALDAATKNLAEHFKNNPDENILDAAFTLQAGRRAFEFRRMAVVRDAADAASVLESRDAKRLFSRSSRPADTKVCFLFPGQGSQQPNMGRELYETERVFREEVDRCVDLLQPHLGLDLRSVMYPAGGAVDEARDKITQTILAQPAIFTVEYALAKLWMSWGVTPSYMIGHSVGEFVAACLAGVFSLPDALQLIATRGRLMQALPAGAMLSVRMGEAEVRPLLSEKLSLAAINAPSLCVVSGPTAEVTKLEEELTRRGVAHRRLYTSHAFHSAMMDPILEPFTEAARKVRLAAPTIPYISGVSGNWITESEALDARYWARHFRQAVNFSSGIAKVREKEECVLLEVGPGNVLATLARQQPAKLADQLVVSSLTDGTGKLNESAALQQALGWLWLCGVQPDWLAYHADEKPRRVSLPTYPFERKRFWVDAPQLRTPEATPSAPTSQLSSPFSGLEASAPQVSTPQSSTHRATTAEQSLTMQGILQENKMSQASNLSTVARKDKLRAMLRDIFQDLSGVDVAEFDRSATFLEMGFDSLFLTQVTQSLQSKFQLKITFRQLLGDLGTLDALSSYLDEKLPAAMFQETSPAAAAASSQAMPAQAMLTPASLPIGDVTAGSAVEQLLRNQLQAMNQLFAQQLAALQSAGATATPPPAHAPVNATRALPASTLTQAKEAEPAKEVKGYTPFKPLQKSVSGELTPRQQKYIRDLIARYNKRTPGSKAKTQEYRQPLADPRVVSGFRVQWKEIVYPIVTNRSKGSHLWDIDGNEYVDLLNGFGPIMLGHRPEFVEKAIEKQLHEGFEIGPQTLLAGEVAKMLCEMTGNERATFCNTGSEAVIAAMRVARTVTGRNKIVFFAGDYHGSFDEVLMKGFKKGGEPQSMPVAPGIPREKAANVIVLEYGTAESLEWIRKNAGDLAAVMVEPVQSRHSDLQPVEFLREIRKITEQSDTCFIFDEVVTGFRVHPGGCQALFGIRADLATYGKVLAGGMPIGVLAGKSKYMDALDGGMWEYGDDSYPEVGVTFMAGTFVRHPLALAACAAVLKHLKEQGPGLQERLNKRTGELVKTLNALLEKNQVPTHIDNFSSFFYFGFPSDFPFASLFYCQLREKGIHILEGFPCFLTTEHSEADLERVVRAFTETIAEMQAGGVLPEPSDKAPLPEKIEEPVLARAGANGTATGSAPMIEAQREIFLAAQLDETASCAFNESFGVHLLGELKLDLLREAVNTLITRHEALRATVNADGATLSFRPELNLEIPLRDLQQMEAEARQAELQHIINEDSRKPFDLRKGPLVRAELARLEADHHVLLFTSHHLVCDGWSTNVLLDELGQLYSAKVRGEQASLPPSVSFSEYARKQAQQKAAGDNAQVEAYWLDKFKDIPAPLELPLDRPRPSVKSYAGATYRSQLDADFYRRVKQLGAKKGCTLFATLLTGFQTLLHRLSNQNDVVVGVPTAGQSLLEDGSLVGHCVNFLPLRTQFEAGATFADVLSTAKKTLLDAYDNQSYTYGTLVRKLGIPRDPGRLPLMEVQFNLERVGAASEFAGLKSQVEVNPKSAVNFDLFFNVVESDRGLTIDCDYNTDLFDRQTIARWLNHYKNLLDAAAANPDTDVDDLPLMTATEVKELIAAWNTNPQEFRVDTTMSQMFERQAERIPENIALVLGEESMTFRELNERANQLARTLRTKGVKADSLVAVCFERSLEMIVSFLAVLKAGGAYVPIDSSYPRERLEMMFADTKPVVVLTQDRIAVNLPKCECEVISVDKDWPIVDREDKSNLSPLAGPNNLAYMIYTSGSAGKPKGVLVPHANVVRLLKATEPWFHFNDEDVWALFHTYSFDVSVWEIWGSLLSGGRLVVVPFWVTRSPQEFYQLLAKERVTVLCQTPVAFYQLIQVEACGQVEPLALRTVILAGEALNFANLRPWIARHGDKKPEIINMYGPTEATVYCTYRRLSAADIEKETRSLIGVPLPDMNIYVLDSRQRPVPPGVAGEMYIAGAGIALGYLNLPELTRERFLPDTVTGRDGSRMYKTGDVVRFVSGGDIDFLGRMDSQVKIHGFRIELGEIEATIAQHPDVREAAAMARQDGPGEKKLVAYFVPRSKKTIAGSELREFLQAKLPAHMIPYAYVQLEALPLNPNGKLDRAKLSAPDPSAALRQREYIAPRTAQEQVLADILAEVLRVERVGVTDNLFELGADSLHVFQITSRAANAGLTIAPRLLLQQRTIAGVLAEMEKAPARSPSAPITPVARQKYRATH
ncbi:MAG: hypothetical protein NVS9B4_08670 [Candidatus Acidiferrum sp.]